MYIRLKQLTNRNIDNTEINVRVNDSSKQLIWVRVEHTSDEARVVNVGRLSR